LPHPRWSFRHATRWLFCHAPVGCFATHPLIVLPHTHWLFRRNRYAVNMNNATGNT
jgi:hypothetical protein